MSRPPGRPSPLNDRVGAIAKLMLGGATNADIVAQMWEQHGIRTSVQAIQRATTRHQVLQEAAEARQARKLLDSQAESPGVRQVNDDTLIITGSPNTPVEEIVIEDILRRRKLNPDEWEVKQILDNQWEANAGSGSKITLYQFKIWLTKKVAIELVFPAIVPIPGIRKPKGPNKDTGFLAFVTGDHQAPHHDPKLHEATLDWLSENSPDVGVIHGDLSDFGYISRHRDDPAWDTSVQSGIQGAFEILYDYRNAATDMAMSLRKGNHDDRVRNEQLERAERMYGITAAQWPGEEPEEWVMSLNHLLHLKELEVEYVEPLGTYEFEQVPLSEYIAVRHGYMVTKESSLKTAINLGHSIVLGHTHRQSILRKTLWNSITQKWRAVTAVEAGCMCKIVGGLGFASAGAPDWQPGFATVQVFSDGNFSAELATWSQDGVLRWRDQEYAV